MDTSTLRPLLWKDFRQNRLVLVVALGILLLSGPAAALASCLLGGYSASDASTIAVGVTTAVSTLLLAMLGGTIVAADRADRSAAFLAYLPPSRKTIVLSKALCTISTLCVVLLLDAGLIAWKWSDSETIPSEPYLEVVAVLVSTGMLMVGAAWMAGSLLGSPAIASVLGIVAPIVVFMCVALIDLNRSVAGLPPYFRRTTSWEGYCIIAASLGLVFFAIGYLHALHRKADV